MIKAEGQSFIENRGLSGVFSEPSKELLDVLPELHEDVMDLKAIVGSFKLLQKMDLTISYLNDVMLTGNFLQFKICSVLTDEHQIDSGELL